jgi:hypothetical protein
LALKFGAQNDVLELLNCLPRYDFAESADGNKLTVNLEILGEVRLNGVVIHKEIDPA